MQLKRMTMHWRRRGLIYLVAKFLLMSPGYGCLVGWVDVVHLQLELVCMQRHGLHG